MQASTIQMLDKIKAENIQSVHYTLPTATKITDVVMTSFNEKSRINLMKLENECEMRNT